MLAPAIPVPQARANRLQIVFERSPPVRQVSRLFEVCREACSAKSSSIKKALVAQRPPGTGARRPPGDLDELRPRQSSARLRWRGLERFATGIRAGTAPLGRGRRARTAERPVAVRGIRDNRSACLLLFVRRSTCRSPGRFGGGRMPQASAGTLDEQGPSGRRAAGAAGGSRSAAERFSFLGVGDRVQDGVA